MSKQSPKWDWTFHYDLSVNIAPSNLSDSSEIKFVSDSKNNITGFEIKRSTIGCRPPRKYCDDIAKKVARWLTAKSMTTVNITRTGYEVKPRDPRKMGRTAGNMTIVYNVKGVPVRTSILDLTEVKTQRLIRSKYSNNLEDLSNAVSHLAAGRLADSIKGAFKIIEKKGNKIKDYRKYKCIRNILTHEKLRKPVKDDFIEYFDSRGSNAHNSFGFKRYVPSKNIIIFNLQSPKTRKTLEQIATDLIRDVKGILGL